MRTFNSSFGFWGSEVGLALCIVASLLAVLFNNITFYLFVSVLYLAVIARWAHISFFTVFSVITVFTLLQTWIQATTGHASGMIYNNQAGVPLYEGIHGLCTISFMLTMLLFLRFTNVIKNEKLIYRSKTICPEYLAIILLILSCVIMFVMFPSLPTFTLNAETRRSQGLFSSYGWVLIGLLLATFSTDYVDRHKSIYIAYFFLIFWSIGHGERVEVMGFAVFLVLKLANNSVKNSNFSSKKGIGNIKLKNLLLVFAGFLFILLMVFIGVYRMRGEGVYVDLSVPELFRLTFSQSTAGDVVYVFDCAVDMMVHGNLLFGKTYFDWIAQLVPGMDSGISAAVVIQDYYYTVGGAQFFVEPMMNFGLFGILITNITFCALYSFLLSRKNSLLASMMFYPMVIEIFRTAWYGRNGWVLTSCVVMPVLYLLLNLVSTNKFPSLPFDKRDGVLNNSNFH